MDQAGDAFLIHDGSGRILEANPSACEILGCAREELLGMNVQDIDTSRTREDGGEKAVAISPRAIDLPDGQTFLAVVEDLTSHKQPDDTYRQLIDAMNDAAFVIGYEEERFLEVNERAIETLQYSREEFLAMGPRDLDSQLTPDEIGRLISGVKSGERQVFRTRHRKKDGTVIPVEVSSSPVSYRGTAAVLSMSRDITARKRDEALTEARLRLLELAARTTLEGFLQATLDELEGLTGSQIGFCNFLEADEETLTPQGWSTRTRRDYCSAGEGKKLRVAEAGVWADCIRVQGPVIHNDYASLPNRKGMPPGHAALTRELVVPVFRGDKIVAVFAVGNKSRDYDEDDVETVSSLADLAWDIAARKLVETWLVESEARSRRLIDASPDAVFLLDANGRYLDCNQTALARYGYTRGELLRMTALDLAVPGLRSQAAEWLQKALETGATFEWRHLRKDGSEFPVEIRAVPIDAGEQPCILSTVRDISDRKLAEEALRKSQSLLKATGRMAKVGGWEIDLETQGITWTDEVYRIHEVPKDFQPTAETAMGFYPPEHRARIEDAVNRAIDTGKRFDLEAPLVTAKGQRRWVHSIGEAQLEDGQTIAITGTIQDITERKQVEDALHESEERFRDLSSMSTEGIMIHQDGVIVDANQALARLVGYDDVSDLFGKSGLETLPLTPDSRRQVEAHLRTRAEDTYEIELTRPDGSTIWVETTGRDISYRGGRARLASMRDVTARKLAEIELRKSEEQLRQSQKMESVGRLAGGIAHDFNNMLGVILGHADLAMQQLDPNQPVLADLRAISDAARRSAAVAQQLLAFARRQAAAPLLLDLNKAVERMLDMLQRLVGEDIELLWLPGSDLGTVVLDPSQLDQVLVNLCANSRDAIAGAGRITVSTDAVTLDEVFCSKHEGCASGNYVVLSVSDDGSGMATEILEHLFEPFFTTKETGKGTGLGLATVYGIVKQNSGYIDVVSDVGVGTTVKIYVPQHSEPPVDEAQGADVSTFQGSGETLLVVEDEPSVLRLAEKVLSRLGYRVLTAETPEEALRVADAHSGEIDLLVTDVIMPEMSGGDLAERLVAVRPNLKTLYMSGYAAEVISGRGLLEKGVSFLQKPFSPSDLAKDVRVALDQE